MRAITTVTTVVVLAVTLVSLRTRCDSWRWFPYEDEDGFGYAEWRCQKRRWHPGRHEAWWR